MNRYIRNFDEEAFARQMDEARKKVCDEDCENCAWSLPDGKCILITAENHISSCYRKRMKDLMERLHKVRAEYAGLEYEEKEGKGK